MLCNHPGCGIDHDAGELAADVQAEAIVDAAETYAEADAAAEHERTERAADDNDTAESIARVQAEAAVQIAEADAAAAVDIAEAETAAAVAIAEAEAAAIVDAAIVAGDGDGQVDELDGAELDEVDDAGELDELPADVEPVDVDVPPQVSDVMDERRAAVRSTGPRTVSAFRARRHR